MFLGACSSLPSVFDTEPPDQPVAPQQTGALSEIESTVPLAFRAKDELLVENLVSMANALGNIDIGGVRGILHPDESEAKAHLMEPMTPTVPMSANRVVEKAMNDYLQNRRSVLRLWLERSATYFPMIEKVFAEEGVPDELKYIALGESGLRATARSGAGAGGMWQFMPATARAAGLVVGDWVDERMDPEKATRAAARHLKYLYDLYGGNWHLALAGYNCSYRCIRRAVERAGGSLETPPSFWEIYPYLPQETRQFVPKFIAAALIVSNPDLFRIHSERVGRQMAYDVVEVSGLLSLEDAARFAGTSVDVLRRLNPALRRSSLPDGEEAFPLKIPFGSYDLFVTAFNSLPRSAKATPAEYVVQSGDTLDKIARSYKTNVAALQAANGLSNHLIYPRQKLLVPGKGVSTAVSIASSVRRFVDYGITQNRPIKLREEFEVVAQEGSTEDEVLMAVVLNVQEPAGSLVPTVYRVRSGDTLSTISERFKVKVADIKNWNNISGSLIYAGQELTLHTETAGATRLSTYRVQQGDNLGGIARRFGLSVDNLKNLNGLRSDIIFPGQNLQLN